MSSVLAFLQDLWALGPDIHCGNSSGLTSRPPYLYLATSPVFFSDLFHLQVQPPFTIQHVFRGIVPQNLIEIDLKSHHDSLLAASSRRSP